jgi:hypothetical protein
VLRLGVKACITTLQFLAEKIKLPKTRDQPRVKLVKTHVSFSKTALAYRPLTENRIDPLTTGISKTSSDDKIVRCASTVDKKLRKESPTNKTIKVNEQTLP